MATKQPDDVLLRRALGGSEAAAHELVTRHWRAVWRTVYGLSGRRALADDVTQDTFERAFAAVDRFDLGRPVRPWLQRIAINRVIDELRRERRLHLVGSDGLEHAAVGPDSVPEETSDTTISAVLQLELDKRAVIVLRFWLDLSLRQIAEVLEIPSGTVASRLSRALEELRPQMEDCHENLA